MIVMRIVQGDDGVWRVVEHTIDGVEVTERDDAPAPPPQPSGDTAEPSK